MRDHITTAFEVVGLVLLVVAGGTFVASVAASVPAGLGVAGVLSLACSAVIVRTATKRPGHGGGEVA